mmetsp:Transcript_34565/g.83619  ORF Transcript_34565/g.83619 Transcript_34565/m.83619 type:complete len:228 (+) Transcript_34565:850-1533(+)
MTLLTSVIIRDNNDNDRGCEVIIIIVNYRNIPTCRPDRGVRARTIEIPSRGRSRPIVSTNAVSRTLDTTSGSASAGTWSYSGRFRTTTRMRQKRTTNPPTTMISGTGWKGIKNSAPRQHHPLPPSIPGCHRTPKTHACTIDSRRGGRIRRIRWTSAAASTSDGTRNRAVPILLRSSRPARFRIRSTQTVPPPKRRRRRIIRTFPTSPTARVGTIGRRCARTRRGTRV